MFLLGVTEWLGLLPIVTCAVDAFPYAIQKCQSSFQMEKREMIGIKRHKVSLLTAGRFYKMLQHIEECEESRRSENHEERQHKD